MSAWILVLTTVISLSTSTVTTIPTPSMQQCVMMSQNVNTYQKNSFSGRIVGQQLQTTATCKLVTVTKESK